MRITLSAIAAALTVGLVGSAYAELQNVEVGGSLRIRGNWYELDNQDPSAERFYEQRTTVNVAADFTDDVSAFIELDHYGNWGNHDGDISNFRSDYDTGEDFSSTDLNDHDDIFKGDISLYQAYIDVKEAWGQSLDIRIGRQEMQFGSEFLVGNNDTGALFTGLSFDAIRLDYTWEDFTVTGWTAKLAETYVGSSDTDFYGIYGTWAGREDVSVDAYAMYIKDSTSGGSTDGFWTLGLRAAGARDAFDYEGEFAYQTGEDASGPPGVDYSAYAFNGEFGYTFEHEMAPRVWLGGAYFSGDDTDRAFNRMFSDWEYSEIIDNTDLSNFWTVRGGASAQVREDIEVAGNISYFAAVEDFAGTTSDELGFEVDLYATYDYSEDLYFQLGAAFFFAEDYVSEPAPFVLENGQDDSLSGEDVWYIYWETGIRF